MSTTQIRALVQELGNLSGQKKQIESIIQEKQNELIALLRDNHGTYTEEVSCDRCDGTGKDLDGECIACDGDGYKYILVAPMESTDNFTCKVYQVSQRTGNPTLARKVLDKRTFKRLFKTHDYRKVDIRPSAHTRATVGRETERIS